MLLIGQGWIYTVHACLSVSAALETPCILQSHMSCPFCQVQPLLLAMSTLAGRWPATMTRLDALVVCEAIDGHQHWLMLEMPYLTQTLPVHAFTFNSTPSSS